MQKASPPNHAGLSRIFLVLPPRVHILDLAGPLQVFGTLPELGIAPVEVRCVGPQSELKSYQGLALTAIDPLPARLRRGDLVVVIGAKFAFEAAPTPAQRQIVDWLRAEVQPRLGEVALASVCTGAFLLGAAGLLDHRPCTTHHHHLDRLQQRHPLARVLPNRMLVDAGHVCTSAGVSAGIDLALHLIARHFGAAVAVRVARENVVPFRRMSRDPALDPPLRHRDHGNALVHAVQDFLSDRPDCTLPYDELAARFAVSYRHLARIFLQECGMTLKQYQQQLRIALARSLLKGGDAPVERIAELCGFGSVQAFRSAWRQEEALPPSQWRANAVRKPHALPLQ
ncbi:GlxA family transcriptional regulator [Burkholderia sp. 22PA0099]|uniref:GlxA family transcriptional regulator n=1 Tax=Burkholderia sp. 22PA0099 TaxID=3237372 RepID=UPI0039C493C5